MARWRAPVLFLGLCLLAGPTQAAEVVYDLTISLMPGAPDGNTRTMIVANGQFPGPTITAQQGDTVVVNVLNMLPTMGTSIHFHGIHQRGTPFMDGAVGITQCAIAPMETFQYRFVADLPGTYYWHAHNAGQRTDGLVGPLVIRPASGAYPFTFDAELPPLLLNDWWWGFSETQIAGLTNVPFTWVGDPKSILLNGKAACAAGAACSPPTQRYVYTVAPGKTYFLRIISATALMYLNLMVEGHQLTVVEADGMYVQPWNTTSLDINSGQRYGVLLTTAAVMPAQTNYWINAETRYRNMVKGQAILQYGSVAGDPPTAIPTNPTTEIAATNAIVVTGSPPAAYTNLDKIPQGNLRAGTGMPAPPPSTRTIILQGAQERINNYIVWTVNHASYTMGPSPVLQDMYYDGKYANGQSPTSSFTPSPAPAVRQPFVLPLRAGEVVDVIIQNTPALNNISEQHPWHLHGHSAWDLGFGLGTYNPSVNAAGLNTINPPLRDTITVYPHGWTAFRFVADNPGAWLLHCHISWHEVIGMMMVFTEGGALPPLPPNFPTCGPTARSFCPATSQVSFNNYAPPTAGTGPCAGSN